ncbi:MAG: hypothetical protein D6814_17985 [Calditrichaeota bacterium]|nr:MAG: hypothetical protein D6814_17985 [Calditrichota bacterium]
METSCIKFSLFGFIRHHVIAIPPLILPQKITRVGETVMCVFTVQTVKNPFQWPLEWVLKKFS